MKINKLEKTYYLISDNLLSILKWFFIDWRKFSIKKNEIVVDLGCGGRPLARANILVDKFLEGLTERPTDFIDNGAYIIQCDLSKLPFKNKSIDFAYSSHTIEHLVNLVESLSEMQRVARRGYITCPSALREQIISHKMHVWFIENKNGRLIINRKEKPYPDYIGGYFDKLLANDGYKVERFEKYFKKEFYINYFWKDKINYKLIDKNVTFWKTEGETEFVERNTLLLKVRKLIIIWGSKMIRYLFSNKFNIENVLCCPNCKGELLFDDNYVSCKSCNTKFKHRDKRIFYFL